MKPWNNIFVRQVTRFFWEQKNAVKQKPPRCFTGFFWEGRGQKFGVTSDEWPNSLWSFSQIPKKESFLTHCDKSASFWSLKFNFNFNSRFISAVYLHFSYEFGRLCTSLQLLKFWILGQNIEFCHSVFRVEKKERNSKFWLFSSAHLSKCPFAL